MERKTRTIRRPAAPELEQRTKECIKDAGINFSRLFKAGRLCIRLTRPTNLPSYAARAALICFSHSLRVYTPYALPFSQPRARARARVYIRGDRVYVAVKGAGAGRGDGRARISSFLTTPFSSLSRCLFAVTLFASPRFHSLPSPNAISLGAIKLGQGSSRAEIQIRLMIPLLPLPSSPLTQNNIPQILREPRNLST